MPEFFQTAMGRRFYEHTMPELVRQLARIADVLQRQDEHDRSAAGLPPGRLGIDSGLCGAIAR